MSSIEKANAYRSTDDLADGGSRNHSKSFGPTNFTSKLTHNNSSLGHHYGSLQFPTISNSRCKQSTDVNSSLLSGPIQKEFIKQNKQQIQRLIRQQMRSVDPFRGYLEISNASQHLKQHQQQNMEMSIMDESTLDLSNQQANHDFQKERSGTPQPSKMRYKGQKLMGNSEALGISSKVMETWINETLADAEHLDIPGVILKPEHKNPISRYAIDRMTLTNAGVPSEVVDRIYRCLFVYSVGFYELIKKILSHCNKKYSIITSIWKVFSVMLEYCCQSDYRMLISEITNQHKEEIDNLEKDFSMKCEEFLNNEKILKQNMEVMQKYSEELEKERTNERNLRLKLEEEYMQNSKNHEEEVQLRLKFESKLNSMHSMHRELQIKHSRLQHDLANAHSNIENLEKTVEDQSAEIIKIKTKGTEQKAKIELLEEKKNTLERDIAIKSKLISDLEAKMKNTQDESDLLKYQLHEQNKLMTEQQLKMDCLETKIEGIKNEKTHLEINLHETKEFKNIFEERTNEMKDKYLKLMEQFNDYKQKLIGYEEILNEKDARIELLKNQTTELTDQVFELDRDNGTLKVELEKYTDYYTRTKKDLDDTVEKLHQTNRVRHELELKLQIERDTTADLRQQIHQKTQLIYEKDGKIHSFEDKCHYQHNQIVTLEGQVAALEQQMQLQIEALQDKNDALQGLIRSEKDARDQWAERFEKESKEHSQTNTEMLVLRSVIKDLQLDLGNVNIKFATQAQQNAQLTHDNGRLQHNLNMALISVENLEREKLTLDESLRQYKKVKKEYIQKLSDEMSLMKIHFQNEERVLQMQIEDYLSQGTHVSREYLRTEYDLQITSAELSRVQEQLNVQLESNNRLQMVIEDALAQQIRIEDAKMLKIQAEEEFKQQIAIEQQVRDAVKLDAGQRIGQLEKEKDAASKEYQEQVQKWNLEREVLFGEIKKMQQAMMDKKNNKSSKLQKNAQVDIQALMQAMKPIMKTQETQTISLQAEVVKVENKIPEDGRHREGPNSKLVSEAAKRRDSMNRKLREQEQLVEQMKLNAQRRLEIEQSPPKNVSYQQQIAIIQQQKHSELNQAQPEIRKSHTKTLSNQSKDFKEEIRGMSIHERIQAIQTQQPTSQFSRSSTLKPQQKQSLNQSLKEQRLSQIRLESENSKSELHDQSYNLQDVINKNHRKTVAHQNLNSSITSMNHVSIKPSRKGSIAVESNRYQSLRSGQKSRELEEVHTNSISMENLNNTSNSIKHHTNYERMGDSKREAIKLNFVDKTEVIKPDSRQHVNLSSKYESFKASVADEEYKTPTSVKQRDISTIEEQHQANMQMLQELQITPQQIVSRNQANLIQQQSNGTQQRSQVNRSVISNKKVVGTSTIKSMIRAAATRD